MANTTVTVQHALENLERDYRSAMEYHYSRGDNFEMRRCEEAYRKRLHDLERKYQMDNNMMGSIFGGYGQGISGQLGQANNQLAMGANQMVQNAAMAQGVPVKSAEEKNGVLFWQGRELPERWMGAFYAMVNRVPVGKQWKISFTSEFSSDTIMLWLSMDEFSGNDADKVAATYLETINQRRLG